MQHTNLHEVQNKEAVLQIIQFSYLLHQYAQNSLNTQHKSHICTAHLSIQPNTLRHSRFIVSRYIIVLSPNSRTFISKKIIHILQFFCISAKKAVFLQHFFWNNRNNSALPTIKQPTFQKRNNKAYKQIKYNPD